MNLTGTTISQYQILEQIGQGGMATVYKAYQPSLDRYVALKVLAPYLSKTENFIARFEREARTLAKLRHKNILTIFDFGRQDTLFYLAMEYVQGGTLTERFGWPQSFDYILDVISQIGQAVAHAHRQGIIHRDIKPANILVPESDWFLLSDFGLVKLVEDGLQLTGDGASLGTPQYMSPEQAQGHKIDHRSDIYALGVVLYEAITGRPPFIDSPMAVIMKQISDPIPPPHKFRSDTPDEIERVVLKALAKSPENRYPSMEIFLEDLQQAYVASSTPHNRAIPQPLPDINAIRLKSSIPTTLPKKKGSPARLILLIIIGLFVVAGLALFRFDNSIPTVSSIIIDSGAANFQLPAEPISTSPPTKTATPVSITPTDGPSATPISITDTPTVQLVTASPTTALPTATPQPTDTPFQQIEMNIWEADSAEMVFVPAGFFVMGSETLGEDERPVRQVYVDDFWLDRYEVTNDRFARFVAETNYRTEAEQQGWGWVRNGDDWQEVDGANWQHPQGPDSDIQNKADHPVVLVSWSDADAYCRWAQKRLPTEAEWEKAARGPADEANIYAWGNTFDSNNANTEEGRHNGTTPVGTFSPQGDSPYGAVDMTGNVWEWVSDWYAGDYYSHGATRNPQGPEFGTEKILRGGSWLFDAFYAQTAFRYSVNPEYTYDFAGFRCSSSSGGIE